ncbi:hypothetical protein GGF44_005553 [Coemansia sp. RSA 1694]|nr:hypothetical protein GGF44_005553 [Coemansia sp. RSA 1694]
MVCVICFGSLFDALAKEDEPSTSSTSINNSSNNDRVAALSCGHTFHLECINLWRNSSLNANCPMCNVCHVGSILTLHIECDLDHVTSSEEDDLELGDLTIDSPLRTAESLCNSSLEFAE